MKYFNGVESPDWVHFDHDDVRPACHTVQQQNFALRGPERMATVIDVLVRPVVPFDELKRHAVSRHIGPLSIPVASIDDLISLKSGTGRSKDVLDIEELRRIKLQLAEGQDGAG